MSGNGSVSCCAQPGALVVIAALPLCQLRDTLDSMEYQLFEGGFIPAGYGAEGACDWPDIDRLEYGSAIDQVLLVPSRFDAHALWIAPMPCPLCRRSAMLCSDLLWDAQSVSRKQVPTLQDALLCCDRETLLSMVEQGYARRLPGWGQATPQQRRIARKRMGRALEAMLDCAVKRKSGKAPVHIPRRALRRACAAGPGMHRAFGAGARGGSVCGRCAAKRR